jgi:hypothetical protein
MIDPEGTPKYERDEELEEGERDGWKPELARPLELTPLPEIERAMPVLGIFRGLLGRRHAPYKVGVIRSLASETGTRWRMREITQRVDWLKPASVNKLVHELAQGNVLRYDRARATYRLTGEARVVASFCRALTVSEIKHGRLIKVLTAAIRTAQAVGAPEEAVFQPFLDAIAVIEEDYEELRSLIADMSEDALRLAVLAAREHHEDMGDLLDHQDDFFVRFQNDMHFLDMVDRAHRALAALGTLSSEVYIQLFEQTDEILRRGLTFDRQDIRDMVKSLSIDAVADLLPEEMALPPMLAPGDTEAFFAALADYLGRPEVTQGLPEPTVILVVPQAAPQKNEFWIAARELEHLGAAGPVLAADWVAAEDWRTAVKRLGATVGAWGRYGPMGTGDLRVALVAGEHVGEVAGPGVARMSDLRIRPREVPA